MSPIHVALASEVEGISSSELDRVADAVQEQIERDFSPIWGVQASLHVFKCLQDIPLEYWPVIVRDDISFFVPAGFHAHTDGRPFAFIQHADNWSLEASHEILEMLVDPFGNRFIVGPSIKRSQGSVEYLVEVCDPCQDPRFSYTVNGEMVSDFITPHYFAPVRAADVKYSFTGSVKAPYDILKNGCLSWHHPISGHWWQLRFFESKKHIVDRGVRGSGSGNESSALMHSTESRSA